jgi:imidazolonepropionase-like amidohydrolase
MLVIKGGTVVPVVGKIIENGVVVIENGKIKSVGKTARIPEGAQVIDASGKWVTPGLIDAHTHLSPSTI